MDKIAYPQGFNFPVDLRKGNLEEWESLFRRIQLQKRSFPDYPIDVILDKYTEKWNERDKYDFIQWFKMKERGEDKLYKKFQKEYNMERYAATIDLGSEERLKQLRRKLRSRIDSADKVLQRIYEEGLLGEDPKSAQKVEYLSNILQKLKNEILTLRRPELVVARFKRASILFKKAGIDESASILGNIEVKRVLKTAVFTELVPQLEKVRDILVKETNILSFDRIKTLTKIIDFFDNNSLNYSDPLKKAINTLLKPLESASNDIYEVISSVNKLIGQAKIKEQEVKV